MEHPHHLAIEGVIFDHDGTLVDSERYHYLIWRDLLTTWEIDFKEADYIREHSGMPSKQNAATLIAHYQLDLTVEALTAKKERLSQDFFAINDTLLAPYAEQCLHYCQNHHLRLGLATGASRALIDRSLGKREFFPFFKAIATGSDVFANKPAPDVYLLALEMLQLPAEKVIAIEDSAPGIAAAKAAQLRCIAVDNPYATDLSQADYVVANLREAQDIIASLL